MIKKHLKNYIRSQKIDLPQIWFSLQNCLYKKKKITLLLLFYGFFLSASLFGF